MNDNKELEETENSATGSKSPKYYDDANEFEYSGPQHGDEDWCDLCQGSGKISTREYESYFGAMYKPCPKCMGDLCESEPPLS